MAAKFKDSNGFILDEFLHTFGKEFCKHEVLWKHTPDSNEFGIQPATHMAHRKLAQTLNLSVEAVLDLLKIFPAACLDLMRQCEMCRRVAAGCKMPYWLKPMARHFRLLNNSMKCNKSELAGHDLVLALWESARVGLGDVMRPAEGLAAGTAGVTGYQMEDESPLLSSQAVAYFVAKHRVREKQVLPVWRRVVQLCMVKMCALVCVGDRACWLPASLRGGSSERLLADLMLLHDHRVSQIEILTPFKLRMLVLLFQLIVAAKEKYHGDERRKRDDARDEVVPPDGVDERDVRDGLSGDGNIVERCEARDDESSNVATPMIGVRDILSKTTNSDRRTGQSSASDKLSFTSVKTSYMRYVDHVQERVVQCKPRRDRRETDNVSDATTEASSENELQTELDQESDIHVLSSDTSDYDISNNSKNNIEAPTLLTENRVEEPGSNIIQQATRYPYKESKSNSNEEQRVVWALVYTELIKRGRSASLISLQHRWLELLHLARDTLLTVWSSDLSAGRNVHPLLLVVAHRFPGIVTEDLPSWKRLLLERQIVLESDIKDIVNKYLDDDNTLLNVTENYTDLYLLKEYVINKNVDDPHSPSPRNDTYVPKENTYNIRNRDKSLIQEFESQNSSINNDVDVNIHISTVFDQIDPSKATVSIILDVDSDEEAEEGNSMRATSDTNNLHAWNEREATSLRKENNKMPYAFQKCEKITERTMKNIDEQQEDKLNYMNKSVSPRSDLLPVKNKTTEFNENINHSHEYVENEQTASHDFQHQDGLSLLQPRKSVIDEKLVKISRILVTPIEDLPEWKKHSRNGIIKCRNFSVKNFTKPVMVDSNRLFKCTPYINTNKKDRKEYESENDIKNEVEIKFKDNKFETDFGTDDDINNGIVYKKYIELYGMPDHLRKKRIRLTKKLKLSRTYFSLNFWCLDSNIQLMKLCKPMSIKIKKRLPRVAKRVELSDINEVRRMNRSILTAQVPPTVDTAQRSSESQEDTNTSRRTNNSLSSDLDSPELRKLLTNYPIGTKISKSVTGPVTKEITSYSNLMDNIIDTMRLEKKNNQNSAITTPLNSLQPTPLPSSETSQMQIESDTTNYHKNTSSTETCSTIQKSTEEVRNNHISNSISNPLTDAKVRQIHMSSNNIKELNVKRLQRMNHTSFNLEEKNIPNVSDLKNMILLLAKNYDTKVKHDYNMKLNRNSLNLHIGNFEKQQRALDKDISKLSKILPQYALNIKPKERVTKNPTAAKQRKKTNQIKSKKSKKHPTLPGSTTANINNIRSIFDEDSGGPNLIIDERTLELNNIDLNNSQINKIDTNKTIQETFNIRMKDKKENKLKRVRKKSKQSKKISETEKPTLNEYEEWQRQKTMALKYFTISMTNASKLTLEGKTAQQLKTTSTEKQSNGCETNISIKRKNTEGVATTSTSHNQNITKRSKFPNKSNVVCISDSSSDDEVQITGCYNAKDTNQAQPDTPHTDKTKNLNEIAFLNESSLNQTANQNVLSTPVYLIMKDTPTPTAARTPINGDADREATNKPLVFQVVPLATLASVLPQNNTQQMPIVVMDDPSRLLPSASCTPCQRALNNQCNCIQCQNTLGPKNLACSVNAIQNVTFQDSRNNDPSSSLLKQRNCPIQEVMTVKDYLSSNNNLTKPLIKVNESKSLLFFCKKYLILTDVNIPSCNPTYRTTFKTNKFKFLSEVLLPSDGNGNVLLLGPKKQLDYINCKCAKGTNVKCYLCHHINIDNPKSFIKIDSYYYKKVCSKPIKYVLLSEHELTSNSRVVLEGNPDLMLVSQMFFKKLADSPLTYVRILSALPDAVTLRRLFCKEVVLYAFDVTQTRQDYTPLVYAQTNGQVTVEHYDNQLVKVMQWILN